MSKISLALSGSGFKFPAHVGAMFAVLDSKHELVEVSGTSGGAIVASMWACEMGQGDMSDIALNKDWRPYVKPQLRALTRGGINSGDGILEFCKGVSSDRKFSQVNRKISVVSTCLLNNSPYVFSNALTPDVGIADAVRASVSIPVLFSPYKYDGRLLVDGVVCNSLPMNHLEAPDTIHVGFKIINTGEGHPYFPKSPNLFHVARRALYHLVDKQDDWAFDSGHFGHTVKVKTEYAEGLHPNISLDVRKRLMEDGYDEMRKYLDSIS